MSGKKIIVSLVFVIGVLWTFPTTSTIVNADTESELASERSELQSELEEKREQLRAVQAELIELEEEINLVNKVIEENEKKMTETEAQIEEVEEEIVKLEEEIDQLEKDIERRHDILKDRMSALQKNGGTISYLDVLFGSQNFTDFIDRISLVTRISQSDQSLLEQLHLDQVKVEEQKQVVDDKLAELEDIKVELDFIQEITLEQKAEHEAKQEELEDKRIANEALIEELEIEDRELEQMIEEARRVVAEQEIIQYSDESNTETSPSQLAAESPKSSVETSAEPSGGGGSIIESLIASGRSQSHATYSYGAMDPINGRFDCSGFVSWAFSEQGVSVPRSTAGLSGIGARVSPSNMQKGDLVFFDTVNGRANSHVGIYLGNGKFLGSQSSTGVAEANMTSGYWANTFKGHVRRVIN